MIMVKGGWGVIPAGGYPVSTKLPSSSIPAPSVEGLEVKGLGFSPGVGGRYSLREPWRTRFLKKIVYYIIKFQIILNQQIKINYCSLNSKIRLSKLTGLYCFLFALRE